VKGGLFRGDYDKVEVIVVNDSGLDCADIEGTREVVRAFGDARVKYIEHAINMNGSAARNTGIMHASGEFISFLDDDDVYLQGRIGSCVEILKKANSDIDAVFCGLLGWNSPENNLSRYGLDNIIGLILSCESKKHYIHTNTVTYRRGLVRKLNGFDESFVRHQDIEFNVRALASFNFQAVPEALVRLNPKPSRVDNKKHGAELFAMKMKLLKVVDGLVPRDLFSSIIGGQVQEMLRYDSERNSYSKYLSDLPLPYLFLHGYVDFLKNSPVK
jgi:glycosyltransferase involved in cell wall biosynthesis